LNINIPELAMQLTTTIIMPLESMLKFMNSMIKFINPSKLTPINNTIDHIQFTAPFDQ